LVDVLALKPQGVQKLDIAERVCCTLALAHLRGYALPVARLPSLLLGGPVPRGELEAAIESDGRLELQDGLVCLRGHGRLLPATRDRLSSHPAFEAIFDNLARSYVRELVARLPTVECVAVAGSFASGGLCSDDDLDLNLFVRDGSKFLSYLTALVLAARYGLRNGWSAGVKGCDGGAPGSDGHVEEMPLPLITKRVCINVIWERSEARPFVRTDAALAFELLNSRPVYNAPYFDSVIASNPWLPSFFPQLAVRQTPATEVAPYPGGRLVPGVLEGVSRLGMGEAVSRRAVRLLHSLVAGYRSSYPRARDCAARKERIKHPYGLLELPRPAPSGRRG